jgi:prolipoprotein diacylglyceryltransferase
VPVAVITFEFDPILQLLGGFDVRWQTITLAVVIATTMILAARLGHREGLRPDDLLYISVGVVPGAVIGGRLTYALIHWDVFGADPLVLLDPSRSGLELAGALVGGTLTGAYVASLLGAPVGRWAHTAAIPVLLAIGGGKLAMVLGGSGQGRPSVADWATAYLGPGPWGSLAPELPSHPSQAYEGIASRDGRAYLVAIAGWALVRAGVSVTWRDPVVLGPFPAGGVIALVLAAACVTGLLVVAVVSARAARVDRAGPTDESRGEPSWPDPAARPRF